MKYVYKGGGGGGSAEAAAAVRLDSESGGRAGKDGGGGGVPAWMKNLGSMVAGWLAKLPQSLALLKRSRDNIKDPLFRFFDREVKLGAAILRTVRADLRELQGCNSIDIFSSQNLSQNLSQIKNL